MRTKIGALLVAAGIAMSSMGPMAASAGSDDARTQARARLEQRASRIDAELGGNAKAVRRQRLMREQRQIEAAIRRIESGQKVDTEEIDRILGETSVERAR
jgi:hypothetical protein